MLNLIFGRKGSGKTFECENAIEKAIAEKRNVFVIMPEQEAVSAERRIVDKFGNNSNLYVEIINFKRLCNRVFREFGGIAVNHIDSAGRLLVLSKVLEDLSDILKIYSTSAKEIGFIEKLSSTLNEFSCFNISPKDLFKASENLENDSKNKILSSKLFDLGLLYSRYEETLKDEFDDKGDLLNRLYTTLLEFDFFHDKIVVLDSFYGFTAQEYKIIERILLSAKDVYITFLCKDKIDDEFFLRSTDSAKKIMQICENHSVKFSCKNLTENKRHRQNSSLFLFEKYFSISSLGKKTDHISVLNNINIFSCGDVFDECKACADIISNLIRNGCRYRDITVVLPDISRYDGLLDSIFERYDIPYHMSKKETLFEKPIVSILMSAFDIYLTSFSQNSIKRFIKSGLSTLEDEEVNLIDCYIKTWGLSGKRISEDEWFMNPDGYSETMSENAKYVLERVNIARNKLLSVLIPFCKSLKEGKTAYDYCVATFEFLDNIRNKNLENPLLSGENTPFFNLLFEALDQIILVLKNNKLNVKRFSKLVNLIVSKYDSGKIPSSLDEIDIAPIELLRCDNTKYIILLGANDGILPKNESANSVFSDNDKRLLEKNGIELSQDSVKNIYDQLFLCYCAVASPSENAYIIYSEKGESGQNLNKSLFISIIQNIIPTTNILSYPFENQILNLNCNSVVFENLFSYKDLNLFSALKKYFLQNSEFSEKVNYFLKDFSEEDSLNINTQNLINKSTMFSSVSRLDQFNRCAFSYFARYILNLQPEKTASLGAIETGNITHRVLEIFCKIISNRKANNLPPFTDCEAKDEIAGILSDYLELFVKKSKKASKRFMYLYSRVSDTLFSLAINLNNELAQSLFTPHDFELSISTEEGINPTSVDIIHNGLKIGNLKIIGKIDRVDTFIENDVVNVRIIDYKTGIKIFNKQDVSYGINLQMLLYLQSIVKSGQEYFGSEINPCGILYLPCRRPSFSINLGEEIESTDGSFKANGLVLNDEIIIRAMEKDTCGKYIPVKFKTDGSMYSNSSVADKEELLNLMQKAENAAAKLASEIRTGCKKIAPYKCPELNSCTFCDYFYLCSYDKALHKTRYELEVKA